MGGQVVKMSRISSLALLPDNGKCQGHRKSACGDGTRILSEREYAVAWDITA